MNRRERRLVSRRNRRWLAALAADPSTTAEELRVAQVLAERATVDGRIWLPADLVDEENAC